MDLPSIHASAIAFSVFIYLLCHFSAVEGRLVSLSKPHHNSVVAYARWLTSQNSWGVLNTISSGLGGAPFGNVVSYSDGLPGEATGIPYFYLSTLDPTPANALKDPRASFSISEYPLGTCGKRDPENPTCAKMTLTGKLNVLENDTEEAKFARNVLYKKHPEMRIWPKDHDFRIFKLTIEDIFLINWYGGPKLITVDDYLNFKMNNGASIM
ncbi:hypothetical protein V2J09_013645 [Rumex salicifolius]